MSVFFQNAPNLYIRNKFKENVIIENARWQKQLQLQVCLKKQNHKKTERQAMSSSQHTWPVHSSQKPMHFVLF